MLAIGLAVGAAIGAGGMYLALEPPWRAAPAAAVSAPDAGAEVATPEKPRKKKRRRPGPGGSTTEEFVDEGPEPIVLGPADRVMSWKGDPVERLTAALDMTTTDEARSLSGTEIAATIDADGGALQRCVVDAVGAAPYAGEVTVKMLVDADGRVTRTRVHAPAFMHDAGLLACLRGAVKKMRYPAVGGSTVVTVPFPITPAAN